MDIYVLNLASGALTNLTNTMAQWDEHAQMSPRGNRIVWMSSMGTGGAVDSVHPRTDYWMMRPDGSEKTQITFFNDPGRPEYVGTIGATAADSAWNRDGTKLMGVVVDAVEALPRLVVLPRESGYALAYQARVVTRHDIAIEFVDAQTGAPLDRFSARPDGEAAVRRGPGQTAAIPPVPAQSSGPSLAYDLRGREEAAFALIAGNGSRTWLESFQPSRVSGYDRTPATVEAHARLAAEYLKLRTGAELFAGAERPILIVHPDEPDAPMRAGLWARGPFDAGQGILVFPDPVSPPSGRIEQAFSLQTVAHALGHAFVARSSRLLPRGEAGILNEGVADLVASGAVAFSGRASVAGIAARGADDQTTGQTLLLRVLEHASSRAAADGLEARAALETAFYRALGLMLPADATLSMARMATEQAARDLPDGAALERCLSAAWLDAGVR